MKITYKGKLDALVPAQRKKIESKLEKLGQLVDGKQEKEAHVILESERHVQRAEITINYHDHPVVGIGTSPDLFTSTVSAIDKVEKQVRKLRAKWRDTKRGAEVSIRTKSVEEPSESAELASVSDNVTDKQVFRANHRADQKPLTLEEAILALEDGRQYLVYRDADTSRLSVLLRRRDGNFDLVEA